MELYKRSFYTVSDFNRGKKIETNAEGEEFAFILGESRYNYRDSLRCNLLKFI